MTSSSEPPPTGTLVPADPLSRAVDHLHAELLDTLPPETDPASLRRELDTLVAGVRATLAGQPPGFSRAGELDRVQLLRSLRGAVLDIWSEANGSILPLMRALESTEGALHDRYSGSTISETLTPFSRKLLREVAHLLRSPLGAIVMMADSMRDDQSDRLQPTQHDRVEIMRKAALSASTITGNLLTLLSDEERVAEPSRFRLTDTIDTVSSVVRPVAEARNSDLVVSCSVNGHRSGPARGLAQTLLTLLLRATLMTRDASITLDVTADSDDVVCFEVVTDGTDTIVSFDRDESGGFFLLGVDPHSRAFSMSADGLGLEAAQRMIRSMGSDLTVGATPQSDVRLSFSLRLPRVD